MVQNTINTKTNIGTLAPGFEMDITGPLVEGVLQQPVNDMNDMLVAGIEPAGPAQGDQLFKIGDLR